MQHRDCQPWSDIIAEGPLILVEGLLSDAELDAVETAVIGGDWPLVLQVVGTIPRVRVDVDAIARCVDAGPRPCYNIADGGLDNPGHVPQWTAREQRWARDAAAGRRLWVPPEQRVPSSAAPVVVSGGGSWPRQLFRWAGAVVGRWLGRLWSRVWPWLAGWTALFAVVVAGLVWAGAPAGDAAGLGVVAATGVCAWVGSRRKPRRRGRGRGRGHGRGHRRR